MYVHAGAAGTPCWCRASCWAVAYALSITLRGQTVSRRACALSRTKRSRASFRPRGMTPSGWSILRWGARPPDWLQRTYLIHVNERLTPRQLHHLPHQTTLHFYDWLNVTLPHWHAFSLDRHPVRVRARKQTPQPKHTHSRLNTWIFPCSTTTISDDGRPLYPHSGYDRQS